MSLGETEDGFIENPYFSRAEFACHCGCGGSTVDARLLEILTTFRAYFNKPMYINSGFRCENHNKAVGGSPRSQHLTGKAADIRIKDVDPEVVYSTINDAMGDWGGLGLYEDFVHIDVRKNRVRWNG